MMSRVASLSLLLCGLCYCCCEALPETRWRPMLGAPTAIQTTDPGLHTAAAEATRLFNSGLNSRTLYRLDRVTKATRQIVSGLKYIFEADLKSTECLKMEERVAEDCNFHDDGVATSRDDPSCLRMVRRSVDRRATHQMTSGLQS